MEKKGGSTDNNNNVGKKNNIPQRERGKNFNSRGGKTRLAVQYQGKKRTTEFTDRSREEIVISIPEKHGEGSEKRSTQTVFFKRERIKTIFGMKKREKGEGSSLFSAGKLGLGLSSNPRTRQRNRKTYVHEVDDKSAAPYDLKEKEGELLYNPSKREKANVPTLEKGARGVPITKR